MTAIDGAHLSELQAVHVRHHSTQVIEIARS